MPVNHYRWVRGFDDYDNWQASGVSFQGARSFYYPAKGQMCADCHMPLTKSADAGNIAGLIHSHQFPAANTALPTANHDAAQLTATEDFLKQGRNSAWISSRFLPETSAKKPGEEKGGTSGTSSPAALQSPPGLQTTFAVGEEAESSIPVNSSPESATPVALLTAPLNRTTASVRRGGTYRVDVVVRTRKLGHFFPGGTVDAFDCWVELTATDDKGRRYFPERPAWQMTAKDRSIPARIFTARCRLTAHGNPINKRNAWATRSVVYVRLIPPGAADTIHYRLQIPPNAGDKIHLQAKVNYRKFMWYNTQFAFAGVRDPHQKAGAVAPNYDDSHYSFTGDPSKLPGGSQGIPDLPIVVMAENAVDLNVLAGQRAAASAERGSQSRTTGRAGTITASGFSCRAIFPVRRARSRKSRKWLRRISTAGRTSGASACRKEIWRRRKQVLEKALALKPDLARAEFLLRESAAAAGPLRRRHPASAHGPGAVSARPRGARRSGPDLFPAAPLRGCACRNSTRRLPLIPKIWKPITI